MQLLTTLETLCLTCLRADACHMVWFDVLGRDAKGLAVHNLGNERQYSIYKCCVCYLSVGGSFRCELRSMIVHSVKPPTCCGGEQRPSSDTTWFAADIGTHAACSEKLHAPYDILHLLF